jgi:hypothetical protein
MVTATAAGPRSGVAPRAAFRAALLLVLGLSGALALAGGLVTGRETFSVERALAAARAENLALRGRQAQLLEAMAAHDRRWTERAAPGRHPNLKTEL